MSSCPIVLYGAFDRHNFGDFLLGHAAALRAAPRPCLFAGLRAVDYSALGGFPVERLGDVLAGWRQRYGDAPIDLLHVGGEILDTDSWEAAVMLLAPDEASRVIARLDADPAGRRAWAADFLGTNTPVPYVVGKGDLPAGSRVAFRAAGGVGLARRHGDFALAVATALGTAEAVTVRDSRTRQALADLGVAASLEPDPATTLGPWLNREISGVRPVVGDYVALQCGASFGDDRNLEALAKALGRIGLPVVAFRAGAAPWHDDLDVYRRLAGWLQMPIQIMESLHVRDIAATIAHARLCLASSLHALIVAGLFGVTATGLEWEEGEGAKLRAYAETWGGFQVVTADRL
ncbi:MAG TPA: polysaccharide pyruvyl transferase family protein [Rhodocyclaceae bacterium]|nr:polysaccharide pyruvyl transferase family protein [Rhodocyclaceae bacterium]